MKKIIHSFLVSSLIIFSLGVISSCSSDSDPPEIPPQQNRAPNAFSLQSVSNSTATSLNPTLNWDAATDPDGDNVKYTVYLDTLESPEKIVASNISETSFTVTDTLIDNTPYYWKVMASDGNGGTTFSSSILNLKTISINIQLSSESTTVKPYQLVVLTSDNHTFNEESYTADFGDTVVNLVKTEDGDIAFIVPNIASNSYELSLTSQNKVGTISFTVEANEVQNVENTIDQHILQPMTEHIQDINENLNDEALSDELRTLLQNAKNLYEIFQRRYNSFTNEEKLILAKFLEANPNISLNFETNIENRITNVVNPIISNEYMYAKNNLTYGRNHHNCLLDNVDEVKRRFKRFIVLSALAALTFELAALQPYSILISVACIAGAVHVAKKVIDAYVDVGMCHINQAIEMIQEEFSNKLSNSDYGGSLLGNSNFLALRESNTSSFTMTNNQFSLFKVKTSVRNLDASDINNEDPRISDIIKKHDEFTNKFNSFKTNFNNLISTVSSWFTRWLSDDAQNIKPITATVEPLPASSPVTVIDGDNSHITLENIPTDITAEVQREGESGLRIKFSADNETLPRTFTATLKYNDGTFEINDEFSVTLETTNPPNAFNLISPENLEENVRITPTLRWNEAIDPDGDNVSYTVYLDMNSTPTTIVSPDNYTDTSFTVSSALQNDTTYYWKVMASDGNGGSIESSVFSFTTLGNNSPNAFDLVPLGEFALLTPTLKWHKATDPDGDNVSYTVYLDMNSTPTTVVSPDNYSDTSFTVSSALQVDTRYYWKVMASDGKGGNTYGGSQFSNYTGIFMTLERDYSFLRWFEMATGDFGNIAIQFFPDNTLEFSTSRATCNFYAMSCTSNYSFDGINLSFTRTTYEDWDNPPRPDRNTDYRWSFKGVYKEDLKEFHGTLFLSTNAYGSGPGFRDYTYENTKIVHSGSDSWD